MNLVREAKKLGNFYEQCFFKFSNFKMFGGNTARTLNKHFFVNHNLKPTIVDFIKENK